MKRIMLVMMVVGMALLGVTLYRTDLTAVWSHLRELGLEGLGVVLLVYVLCAVAQVGSWVFTLRSISPSPAWIARLMSVWIVGFAMESTMPLAGLGGEPVKAILLKKRFGIRYTEATASLVLSRTTDMIGQTIFISIGFVLMFRTQTLSLPFRMAAGAGLVLMLFFIIAFLAAQQQRTLGRVRGWLERGWLGGRTLGARAIAVLDAMHDIDDRLIAYYGAERGRMLLSVVCAFTEWFVGIFAVYFGLAYLGHAVSIADAIVIEAFLVLVRSTFFFVPADLGTQEGALALITGAITGAPELGVALSAIRRTRDVLWIACGLVVGWIYSVRRADYLEAATSAPEAVDDGT